MKELKELIKNPPAQKRSLVFLVERDRILLAMKKRGFGAGKWNGVGGKPDDLETIEETAKRETKEEVGVTPLTLEKVATLNFYFVHKPEWNQQVIVFISKKWEGEPRETEEMKPKWFDFEEIPYDKMWDGDERWLKRIIKGEKLVAHTLFDENERVVEVKIKPESLI